MGLDMYLYRERYVKNYEWREEKNVVTLNGEELPLASSVREEIGYWRKMNAVHAFFVDVVGNGEDNCQDIWVKPEHLKDLLSRCQEILAKGTLIEGKITNGYTVEDGEKVYNMIDGKYLDDASKEIAASLLPTQDGFFFGCTDYDEWYVLGIEETATILTELMAYPEWEKYDYYYRASW